MAEFVFLERNETRYITPKKDLSVFRAPFFVLASIAIHRDVRPVRRCTVCPEKIKENCSGIVGLQEIHSLGAEIYKPDIFGTGWIPPLCSPKEDSSDK